MSGIRLPTIELPKFSGGAAEWLSFRDTFESLIHKNETIDCIQKFHYLRASLEGVAAQRRLLAHNHIKAIFDIQSSKEESAAKIRETIDTLNKHLLALNALDQSTEHWDTLLIYLISTKLDNVTARAWEEERVGNDIPTLSEFKSFLNSRADLLDSLELNNKEVQKTKQNEHAKTRSLLVQKQDCVECKENHKFIACTKFLDSSPQKRASYLKEAKLCLNCMRPGHFLKDCRASTCKHCSGKHNSLLHFERNLEVKTPSSEDTKASSVLCSKNQCNSFSVLLAIVIVLVIDSKGKSYDWRHIPTKDNPSDLLSRGVGSDKLIQSELWWHGPSFLVKQEADWPALVTLEGNIPEVKGTCCITTDSLESSIFKDVSSSRRIIRVIAYCKRFLYNCKERNDRKIGALSTLEISESFKALIKIAQSESFPIGRKNSRLGKMHANKSLITLNPFIDDDGLLRVGGRLGHSEFSNDKKHPIVLSAKHRFTKLILIDEHLRMLHLAPQALLASTREKFWIIGGKNLVKHPHRPQDRIALAGRRCSVFGGTRRVWSIMSGTNWVSVPRGRTLTPDVPVRNRGRAYNEYKERFCKLLMSLVTLLVYLIERQHMCLKGLCSNF
ncbi:hypothetical protein ALC57_13336 [Trachymyrmex cornetzi]|uniref:CCHC-type domain-containing protein n=1 Tax=Trachymyrmex cornetzi TaxID=471704 RepID=A0A151IZJ4_9HYME|nr:hypothetical protein ALC57_13336 [Trachymyrmex cornetzi]